MVAALDLAAVESTRRQRHGAMRADVAQRENRAVAAAPNEDRLAEHDAREDPAAPQPPARRRVIPGLAQRRRAVLHARSSRHGAGDIARPVLLRNAALARPRRREGYHQAAPAAIFAPDAHCRSLAHRDPPCSASFAIPVPEPATRAARCWRWAISTDCTRVPPP